MKTLYNGAVNTVDTSIGALLESDGNKPGELISYLVKEQFERIIRADRFYFENKNR